MTAEKTEYRVDLDELWELSGSPEERGLVAIAERLERLVDVLGSPDSAIARIIRSIALHMD